MMKEKQRVPLSLFVLLLVILSTVVILGHESEISDLESRILDDVEVMEMIDGLEEIIVQLRIEKNTQKQRADACKSMVTNLSEEDPRIAELEAEVYHLTSEVGRLTRRLHSVPSWLTVTRYRNVRADLLQCYAEYPGNE